ncbi:MAG TPA: hypothetical protein GX509_08410 [Firmicutes bacterium]|nr:hypothetical protein [Bacillota bacterium]
MLIATIIIILGLVTVSIWERGRQKRERWAESAPQEPEARPSPISEAIVEFVGVSGGIYLALIALVNFLKLNVPQQAKVLSVEFDPIAAIAIFLGIIQPFILRIRKMKI